MHRRALIRLNAVVFALAALFAVPVATAHAAPAKDAPTTMTVTHAPATPTLVQGEGIGAVRTFNVPITVKGSKAAGSFLSGTLTTLQTGLADGHELRASNLTFVVGSEPNQIVVGGISLYPTESSTLATGQSTVRPVIGGSGKYVAARGWVVSTNLGTQGWKHVFHIWTGK